MPESTGSPPLRARTNITSSDWLSAAGKPRSRSIRVVAQPSPSVCCSDGIANWLNGTAVTYTSAPATERPPHADTWKRTVRPPVESGIGLGVTRKRSTSRRAGGATWPMVIEPVPLGQPVTGSSVTTAVGADVAVSLAMAFVAVTRTRSVLPTSACLATYVFAVAPAIDEQLPPAELQLRHWYVNEIGCVPDHVPGSAVCVAPATGEPEMVGGLTTRGRADPWTTAVGLETAVSEPSPFEAVTRTRSLIPTSASRTRYVESLPAEPPMAAQLEPSAAPPSGGQRSQR